ncbi:hypothetical protein ACLOJK_032149 [Asimina triloba]
MKLSFSIPSKPKLSISSKPSDSFQQEIPDDPKSHRQYVTEFDGSQTDPRTAGIGNPPHPNIVIPPQPNTFNPLKKMRNLVPPDPAADAAELRFELEGPSVAAADSATLPGVSYGLNLRNKDESAEKVPANPSSSVEDIFLQKYKADMERVPEDRGFAEFDDVPVEGFGAALLAGYGWKEGMGIGRSHKEDVKIVQYVPRSGKEGLGFVPEFHDTKRKRGDGRPSDPPLVAPKGPDGRTRHVVDIDEKLIPREPTGVFVGKVVRIVDGRHTGLKGKVIEMSGSDSKSSSVVLELSISGEKVSVGVQQVVEVGSVEEEKYRRKLQDLKIHDEKRESRSSSDRHKDKKDKRRVDESRPDDNKMPKSTRSDNGGSKRQAWLARHIRVRIISHDFRNGRLYLKKGEVMDVVEGTRCDLAIDESKELIQGIDQEMLETALPRRGGPVLVLYGKYKGVFGTLVEKDNDKGMGVVRDADNHELLTLSLDEIAEYVGDPSLLGY